MITKNEFRQRFIDRIVNQSKMDYVKDAAYLTESADATWEMWSNLEEGLQDNTPEDMADEEMGCWE